MSNYAINLTDSHKICRYTGTLQTNSDDKDTPRLRQLMNLRLQSRNVILVTDFVAVEGRISKWLGWMKLRRERFTYWLIWMTFSAFGVLVTSQKWQRYSSTYANTYTVLLLAGRKFADEFRTSFFLRIIERSESTDHFDTVFASIFTFAFGTFRHFANNEINTESPLTPTYTFWLFVLTITKFK